jgi:hypothetical protein
MSEPDLIQMDLTISVPDSTEEELDHITRRLVMELRDMDVESVKLLTNGEAPEGTKGGDSTAIGVIAMSILPSILSTLLEHLLSWSLQGQSRTIKFKGSVANQQIEFEGSLAEMQKLMNMLEEKNQLSK